MDSSFAEIFFWVLQHYFPDFFCVNGRNWDRARLNKQRLYFGGNPRCSTVVVLVGDQTIIVCLTVAYLGGHGAMAPSLARPWKFFTGDFIWKGAFFCHFPARIAKFIEFGACFQLCFKLAVSLQHCAPYVIVHWVYIRRIWRPLIGFLWCYLDSWPAASSVRCVALRAVCADASGAPSCSKMNPVGSRLLL